MVEPGWRSEGAGAKRTTTEHHTVATRTAHRTRVRVMRAPLSGYDTLWVRGVWRGSV